MNARDPSMPIPGDDDGASLQGLAAYADRAWDDKILPSLTDYIGIPSKSPIFDPDWAKNGFVERVVLDTATWI
jgi:hypothetical protein